MFACILARDTLPPSAHTLLYTLLSLLQKTLFGFTFSQVQLMIQNEQWQWNDDIKEKIQENRYT